VLQVELPPGEAVVHVRDTPVGEDSGGSLHNTSPVRACPLA
jgi:hypothetical protein